MTKALVITTTGINCDLELAEAFDLAGATPISMHLNRLLQQPGLVDEFDLECDPRSNIHAGGPGYQSSRLPIFAAGDCRRGQSLVVWAIHEGREVAQAVDEHLQKRSQTSAVA